MTGNVENNDTDNWEKEREKPTPHIWVYNMQFFFFLSKMVVNKTVCLIHQCVV